MYKIGDLVKVVGNRDVTDLDDSTIIHFFKIGDIVTITYIGTTSIEATYGNRSQVLSKKHIIPVKPKRNKLWKQYLK